MRIHDAYRTVNGAFWLAIHACFKTNYAQSFRLPMMMAMMAMAIADKSIP